LALNQTIRKNIKRIFVLKMGLFSSISTNQTTGVMKQVNKEELVSIINSSNLDAGDEGIFLPSYVLLPGQTLLTKYKNLNTSKQYFLFTGEHVQFDVTIKVVDPTERYAVETINSKKIFIDALENSSWSMHVKSKQNTVYHTNVNSKVLHMKDDYITFTIPAYSISVISLVGLYGKSVNISFSNFKNATPPGQRMSAQNKMNQTDVSSYISLDTESARNMAPLNFGEPTQILRLTMQVLEKCKFIITWTKSNVDDNFLLPRFIVALSEPPKEQGVDDVLQQLDETKDLRNFDWTSNSEMKMEYDLDKGVVLNLSILGVGGLSCKFEFLTPTTDKANFKAIEKDIKKKPLQIITAWLDKIKC